MIGKYIPMMTQYIVSNDGITTRKVPMYSLQTAEEVKKDQERLGKNAGWYYGTDCTKCCGVYPKFISEQTFEALGYYVCLVCGKESLHKPMPWQSRDDWNNNRFVWKPPREKQMTIFDYMGGD